ncbi:MAG: CarD family transcriptional regulator, partial [Candidatus Subteraquimicrobiales bacterium]|nr:CarD family transcriptional regulator [Candidatus Subteraquimicrobiales bacterium]
FIKEDALIIFSERKLIKNEAEKLYEEQFRYFEDSDDKKTAYPLLPPQNLFSKIKRGVNFVSIYPKDSFPLEKIEASLPDVIPGNFDTLREEVKRLSYEGFLILIVLNDRGRIERLSELFLEEGISFKALKEKEEITFKKGVCLATGLLRQGFVLKTVRLAVFGEENIFKKRERRRVLKQTTSTSPLISLSFPEGDYVVHTVHGIARYGGLCQREMEGIIKDYLLLHYAGEDRLYVPVEQFHRVSKYIGAGGERPKVSRLNSREWLRSKNRAKESAKKLAVDLMKLYSLRASSSGFTFLPDTPWQKELEDSFSFEETLDQFKAVKDVKKDMEIPRPMDRLICGDVGYGKTEVAIRAVFKVVMSGKQVIVLVPTTILAQQHHSTFQSRFFVFPIIVEMLSRFKTPKEQERILLEFALGKIDVLIGTHRLLQKDIIPNDLGLVVVDEEQRFGVAHKEHLKSLRETVDVLTLTATPIPRTLQMALTGVRDISIINTPPEDRL